MAPSAAQRSAAVYTHQIALKVKTYNSENRSSENEEPSSAVELVSPERTDVEGISGGTEGQRQSGTQQVLP